MFSLRATPIFHGAEATPKPLRVGTLSFLLPYLSTVFSCFGAVIIQRREHCNGLCVSLGMLFDSHPTGAVLVDPRAAPRSERSRETVFRGKQGKAWEGLGIALLLRIRTFFPHLLII